MRFFCLITMGMILWTNAFGCNHHRHQAIVENGMFDVRDLKWKKRILIATLDTADSTESARLRASISLRQRAFDNRHLILIQLCEQGESRVGDNRLSALEANAIKTHFGIKEKKQGIWLVGKDGTIKASYDFPLNLDAIFALIDTMSMRQEEMKFDR